MKNLLIYIFFCVIFSLLFTLTPVFSIFHNVLLSLSKVTASTSTSTSKSAAQVSVVSASTEDMPITLSGIGTVQPYNTVSVKSRVDGEIVKILFHEGQDINAGDPLAVIDPRPYEAKLRQREAKRLKDLEFLQSAVLDLQRFERLLLKNYASQQQVDQQRAIVEQHKAQVKTDEAQIDLARLQLDYTTIQAPISGRVGIRLIDQGNIMRAAEGSTLVVIGQIRPVSVIFSLPAALVAQNRLKPGRTSIPVAAYAADDTSLIETGTVELVDTQVDPATGTIKLKAVFPNDQLKLWPGDFINGRITVDVRRHGVTVPAAAVRHGPRGDFVWLVKPNQTVETRGVTVGPSTNGRVLLEKGVKSGDLVVTEGHFRLDTGMRVETTRAEGKPAAGATAATLQPQDPG